MQRAYIVCRKSCNFAPDFSPWQAAMNTMQRFAELGLVYRRMAQGATRKAGYDFI